MIQTSTRRRPPDLPTQNGSAFSSLLLVLVILICLFGVYKLVEKHVLADSPKITSGLAGYCLDDHDNKSNANTVVDNWKCNNTMAQDWVANISTITHDDTYCLTVQGNKINVGAKVVLNTCDGSAGQVWLRDQTGYQNPNSGLCLTTSQSTPNNQLIISDCNTLSNPQQTWTPTTIDNKNSSDMSCTGTEGNRVACNAIKEWADWQSNTSNHEVLLTKYTDGAPYERWCADFVSYVYKEAGYPFTQGNSNGWDENIADNIQYMGFTLHSATSNYIPQTGDVAYFNYAGGHVEIVVSGGKTPTFIYGDSATIDPTTGNGQMMANTITQKGDEGQVVYYLSPN
ncbi:MAG: ricin-type beta-trefoil lectin domain protein [Candidatus Saccharimonadales bacterium]|jgi:hypothetical protein